MALKIEDLCIAIKNRDIPKIRKCLDAEVDVNSCDKALLSA